MCLLFFYYVISLIFVYNCFFVFNDTATTEIYSLSLHDALPISCTCRYWNCGRQGSVERYEQPRTIRTDMDDGVLVRPAARALECAGRHGPEATHAPPARFDADATHSAVAPIRPAVGTLNREGSAATRQIASTSSGARHASRADAGAVPRCPAARAEVHAAIRAAPRSAARSRRFPLRYRVPVLGQSYRRLVHRGG